MRIFLIFSRISTNMDTLELIVTFLGIVSGAFIAIYVLWKGEIIKQNSESDRLDDEENYLASYVDSLKGIIEKQIEFLESAKVELNTNVGLGFTFKYLSNINTEEIDWISKQDRYYIFVKNRIADNKVKIELLRKFNSKSNFLNSFLPEFKEFKNDFMSKHGEYEKLYATNIKKVAHIKDSLIRESIVRNGNNLINEAQNPFLFHLNRIIILWLNVPNALEMDVAMQHFITPLIALCNLHPETEETLEILQYATECREAFSNIESTKTFYTGSMDARIESLKDTLKDLQTTIEDLNKLPKAPHHHETFFRFLVNRAQQKSDTIGLSTVQKKVGITLKKIIAMEIIIASTTFVVCVAGLAFTYYMTGHYSKIESDLLYEQGKLKDNLDTLTAYRDIKKWPYSIRVYQGIHEYDLKDFNYSDSLFFHSIAKNESFIDDVYTAIAAKASGDISSRKHFGDAFKKSLPDGVKWVNNKLRLERAIKENVKLVSANANKADLFRDVMRGLFWGLLLIIYPARLFFYILRWGFRTMKTP